MIPKFEVTRQKEAHEAGKYCAWLGRGGPLFVFTRIESDVKGDFQRGSTEETRDVYLGASHLTMASSYRLTD